MHMQMKLHMHMHLHMHRELIYLTSHVIYGKVYYERFIHPVLKKSQWHVLILGMYVWVHIYAMPLPSLEVPETWLRCETLSNRTTSMVT